MQVGVFSEVGPLEHVVVHRPGPEIVRMTQFELDRLLFDDILAPDVAGLEHDVMCEILASEGALVEDIAELLVAALQRAPEEQVLDLVHRVADRSAHPELAPLLADLPRQRLAHALIEGLGWDELPDAPLTLARLRARFDQHDTMALAPLPNLMFTRDPCISVFDRVVVGRMATDARARESLLVRFALTWAKDQPAPLLFETPDWDRHPSLRNLEGGDVLVLSPEMMLIGCSERTTPQTVQRVAQESLFPTFPHLRNVYAVCMPALRSVMHLDTVLTQVDTKLFLGFAPMIAHGEGVNVVRLSRDGSVVHEDDATVLDILRRELGSDVELVPCGGAGDVRFQQREQWTDGANAVCLGPGRILLYSRNVRTARILQEAHGFQAVGLSIDTPAATRADLLALARGQDRVVYTFDGSELSRARGGARCMTMPLLRGSV